MRFSALNSQIMDTYMKPEEVADILRVSTRAVYGWLRDGKLEAYRPYGRWLITPEQVDSFVKGKSDRVSVPDDASPLDNVTKPVSGPVSSPVRPNSNPLAGMKRNKRGRT